MLDDDFTIKTSGEKREFKSGSVRDSANGKPRFSLISPLALRRLAMHYTKGAEKYGDYNWALGQPLSVLFDSLKRHIQDFEEGKIDEDHLSAMAFNCFAMIHNQEAVKHNISIKYNGEWHKIDPSLIDLPIFKTGE